MSQHGSIRKTGNRRSRCLPASRSTSILVRGSPPASRINQHQGLLPEKNITPSCPPRVLSSRVRTACGGMAALAVQITLSRNTGDKKRRDVHSVILGLFLNALAFSAPQHNA